MGVIDDAVGLGQPHDSDSIDIATYINARQDWAVVVPGTSWPHKGWGEVGTKPLG
jgi:hypothetical protein